MSCVFGCGAWVSGFFFFFFLLFAEICPCNPTNQKKYAELASNGHIDILSITHLTLISLLTDYFLFIPMNIDHRVMIDLPFMSPLITLLANDEIPHEPEQKSKKSAPGRMARLI